MNQSINKPKKQIPPMLEFVWSFLRDIVVIAIVITGFKGLNFFIEWINKVMPVSQESSTIQPYFGLEMTRWMVTMMDIVAMASITLICAYTIYKNFTDLYRRTKFEPKEKRYGK